MRGCHTGETPPLLIIKSCPCLPEGRGLRGWFIVVVVVSEKEPVHHPAIEANVGKQEKQQHYNRLQSESKVSLDVGPDGKMNEGDVHGQGWNRRQQ